MIIYKNKPVSIGDKINHQGLNTVLTEKIVEENPELFIIFPEYAQAKQRCSGAVIGEIYECFFYESRLPYPFRFKTSLLPEKSNGFTAISDFLRRFEPATKKDFEKQELLAEAKRRYKAGDRVSHANIYNDNCLSHTLTNLDIKYADIGNYHGIYINEYNVYNGRLGDNWAEIIEPLFITDDGVKLYSEEDIIYQCPALNNDYYPIDQEHDTCAISANPATEHWMNFSTPEARDNWIKQNTICKAEDGKNIYTNSDCWFIIIGLNDGISKDIAQNADESSWWKVLNIKEEAEKLDKPIILDPKNTNTKRFSTKEAAEQWLKDQFVFISKNGVNIYSGQHVWSAGKNMSPVHVGFIIAGPQLNHKNYYFFSTPEARDKFVEGCKKKDLVYYTDMLMNSTHGAFYIELIFKDIKLFYTKVLELIAKDLNGDWKPVIGEKHHFIKCQKSAGDIEYTEAAHISVIYNLQYFKNRSDVRKAIEILGKDVLNLIFEQ
jgi:hypothetical protein